MKGRLGALGLMAIAAALYDPPYGQHEKVQPQEGWEARQRRLKEQEIKRNIARGLTRFEIDGKTVWALNQKNAERKARKQSV